MKDMRKKKTQVKQEPIPSDLAEKKAKQKAKNPDQ